MEQESLLSLRQPQAKTTDRRCLRRGGVTLQEEGVVQGHSHTPSPSTHQRLPPWLTARDHGEGAGDGLGGGSAAGAPGHRWREARQAQVHTF